jgi:hypothetical protein
MALRLRPGWRNGETTTERSTCIWGHLARQQEGELGSYGRRKRFFMLFHFHGPKPAVFDKSRKPNYLQNFN